MKHSVLSAIVFGGAARAWAHGYDDYGHATGGRRALEATRYTSVRSL